MSVKSIEVGDPVPNFLLKDQNGNNINFNELLGKSIIVLYFYPKDNSPGCTAQACTFRDQFADFADNGKRKTIVSPDTKRQHRLPPGQWLTDRFPVLHYGNVPRIDISKWRFTITGLVEKDRVLNFEEFRSLPRIKMKSDIHCVTTWSKLNTVWEGVQTSELKKIVEILPEAKHVVVHAEQGFTTNLTLDDFFTEDVIFAINYENKPITPEHGYPVRLVVPRLYFWKSAKWVTGVEFTKDERLGFWESNGYHRRGDPWKEERYS